MSALQITGAPLIPKRSQVPRAFSRYLSRFRLDRETEALSVRLNGIPVDTLIHYSTDPILGHIVYNEIGQQNSFDNKKPRIDLNGLNPSDYVSRYFASAGHGDADCNRLTFHAFVKLHHPDIVDIRDYDLANALIAIATTVCIGSGKK